MKTMSLIMNGNKYLASFLIFYSVLCLANSEIPDFKARYLFESERFDFQGVRQLKTVDDQRIFSFDDDSSLIKAEFKSKFISKFILAYLTLLHKLIQKDFLLNLKQF